MPGVWCWGCGCETSFLEAVSSALIYFLQKDSDSSHLSLVETFIFACALSVGMIPLDRRSGTALGVKILVGPRILGVFCLVDGCPPSQPSRGGWAIMIPTSPALAPHLELQILLFLLFLWDLRFSRPQGSLVATSSVTCYIASPQSTFQCGPVGLHACRDRLLPASQHPPPPRKFCLLWSLEGCLLLVLI